MNERDPIGVDERELDDLALEALAEAHATPPPTSLRARLLGAARRHARGEKLGRAMRRWRAVGAMAATLVLVLGGLVVNQHGQLVAEQTRTVEIQARLAETQAQIAQRETQMGALAREKSALEARLDEQARTLVGLRESVEAQGELLKVLSGPRTIMANLAPKGDVSASARVMVDPTTGAAALVVADLGLLSPAQTYELWAIRGSNAPEPAGVFTVGPDRTAAVRLPSVPDPRTVTAFAVSIEPAGGSPSPTGPIVLVGGVG